ncbi:hypothetical protein ACTXJ8_09345 [Corynebacterium variabile]|uniref:hypothetical protein n=1 Tax=Corynebacterium variabile TaxID=1727 RepID=UPI003FD19563
MTITTDATESRTGVRWRLSWCVVLTAVVLWPFAVAVVAGWDRDSALLLRDLSVPGSMALNDLATGAHGLARAVPQDAVLAVLSPVLPPTVVVGLLMCACGTAGAWGATVLAQRFGAGRVGQALASFLVVWNPYVAERLLQGHWSVVAAGMLLPLVAWLSLGRRRVWLVVALAVCALTPTGLILAVVTAVVASGWRWFSLVPAVAGAVLSLPWVIPSLGDASATLTDAGGASLFAARAEPWVGTLGALAGLGGIWNADAVPDHRVPVAGVLLAVAAVVVAVVLWRRGEWSGGLRRLSVLAVTAVLVPALLATGPGVTLLGEVLEILPGAGLLRDTQKFVVLALPALVILLARVDVPVPRVASAAPVLAAGFLAFLQVPALPVDLSDLRPTTLERGYADAVDSVEDAGAGRTLLWPPGNYRIIDGRPALDPLLKMLPGSPVDPGYLIVDGRIVDGDPDTVRLLSGLAAGDDGLAEAGVDLVLVETDATEDAGVSVPAVLTDGASPHELLWSADGWELYRVR